MRLFGNVIKKLLKLVKFRLLQIFLWTFSSPVFLLIRKILSLPQLHLLCVGYVVILLNWMFSTLPFLFTVEHKLHFQFQHNNSTAKPRGALSEEGMKYWTHFIVKLAGATINTFHTYFIKQSLPVAFSFTVRIFLYYHTFGRTFGSQQIDRCGQGLRAWVIKNFPVIFCMHKQITWCCRDSYKWYSSCQHHQKSQTHFLVLSSKRVYGLPASRRCCWRRQLLTRSAWS